jgi:hypothetical protein
LKAVAAYLGDKALGGLIGGAATTLATYMATRTPIPAPTARSLHLGSGTYEVFGADTAALTLLEELSITKESRDEPWATSQRPAPSDGLFGFTGAREVYRHG